MRGYFNGRDRISATAKSQTLEQIFKTALTVVVVEIVVMMYGTNVKIMAAGANLATTLSVLLSFGYLALYYKLYKRKPKKPLRRIKQESAISIVKKIIWVSFPIAISAIMSTLNKNVDSMTVIRILKEAFNMPENQAILQYGILSGKVDTLITLPLSFNVAFSTALVPTISAAIAVGDKKGASRRISFSMLLTMIIGLPFTFGMAVFAQPILNLVFPNATSGAVLLQLSAFTIVFSVLAQTANGALQGMGRIMVPAVSGFVGLVVKIISIIALIQIIGVNGAAIGSSLNNVVVFLVSYMVLKKTLKLNLKTKKFIIKPVIATFIMSVSSYVLYTILTGMITEKISTIIAILFAVIIYILAVIALKIFTKEEMLMIPYGSKLCKMLEKLGIY